MKNYARIIESRGHISPNGRERIMRVRAGRKGKGRQFGPDIIYWPWSEKSCESADTTVAAIAEKYGLTLVGDDDVD